MPEILESPPSPIQILYQDEWFVAVRKPAGYLVHRTRLPAPDRPFLLQAVRNQLKRRVYPIHRLDSKTSGILLMGLTSEAAAKAAWQFKHRKVSKTYLAVTRGWFTPPNGIIDRPLKPSPDEEAKSARTDYRTLAVCELPIPMAPHPTSRYSLMEAIPKSGRRQQIRRHFEGCAHPIIGDGAHGDRFHNRMFRDTLGCDRLLLFATGLTLFHPWLEKDLVLSCPPDTEVQVLLHRLFPDFPLSPRLCASA